MDNFLSFHEYNIDANSDKEAALKREHIIFIYTDIKDQITKVYQNLSLS